MNERKKNEWFEAGYDLVAKKGFVKVSVNVLAQMVNKSKSSFYHHFGDLEIYQTELLDYHLDRLRCFSKDIKHSKNIDPDLIEVFIKYQNDMFFNKQLRVLRGKEGFEDYLDKAFEIYEEIVTDKLTDYLGLGNRKYFAKKLFRFISEHYIFSITEDSYTHKWVGKYLNDVASMIYQIKANK